MNMNYFSLVTLAMGVASRILGWRVAVTNPASEAGIEISSAEWEELGYIVGQALLQQLPGMGNEDAIGIVKGFDRALDEFFPDFRNTLSP